MQTVPFSFKGWSAISTFIRYPFLLNPARNVMYFSFPARRIRVLEQRLGSENGTESEERAAKLEKENSALNEK